MILTLLVIFVQWQSHGLTPIIFSFVIIFTFQGGTPNQQTFTTDFGVNANVIVYKCMSVFSNVLINDTLRTKNLVVSNSSLIEGTLDISNNSETSFKVRDGGNFSGNLNVLENLNVESGATVMKGNLHQKSITFLSGNYDAYDTNYRIGIETNDHKKGMDAGAH